MFDQEDGDIGVALGVVFGVLALVIALVIGLGVHQLRGAAAAGGSATSAAGAGFTLDGSDVEFLDIAEEGALVAKIYFALGQKELAGEATDALAPVLAALRARPGSKALLSGFHDESGGAAINAQVAAARAIAVRSALLDAGIDASRILLRRPAVTLGGGNADEARRVEVRIQ